MNIPFRHIPFTLLSLALLSACSQTKNLPEDEYLYTGIKELSYGAPLKQKKDAEVPDSTGVISAVGHAASYVKQLLSGQQPDKSLLRRDSIPALTPEQKDSLRIQREKDKETYEHVREEVVGALSYAPNGSLMGSSKVTQPFTPGLWIWNRYVNSESRFGKWMFNNFSQNPRTMTMLNPDVRTQVARSTLFNNGYFNGRVDYQIVPQKNPRKQKISYAVLPGPLWHLDRIEYKKFPEEVDSILRRHDAERLLHSGAPFSAADLQNERERIASLLQNRGYYYVQPTHIAYRADTVERAGHVQLEVVPAPGNKDHVLRQYYLGNTRVMLYKFDDRQIHDSIGTETSRMLFAGGKQKSRSWFARQYKRFAKRMSKAGRTVTAPDSTANRPTWVPPLRYGAIHHYLYYNKGDRYNRSRMDRVLERISGMGVFSSVQMAFVPRDSTDTLDIRIRATLDKPYDSEFEGRITYKSNGQLGPGASYTISKKNAFRGAETLSFGVDASYEWQTGANMSGQRSLLNSWELGANLNLSYPRFMFFGLGRRMGRLARATTNFKVDGRWSNRAAYYSRFSLGGRVYWTLQRQQNIQHEITPFHLVYERQLSTTERFDEVMAKNPALAVSMRDQFVPSMEYTLKWRSRTKRYIAGQGVITLNKRSTSALTLNVKQAGGVVSCLYAIGGKPFSESDKSLFGVPFAQFIKASVDYVHTYHITPRQQLLTRAYLGALQCYGNSITAPYGDLFAAGGANSIRGFAIRSIGPGSYKPSASNYSYLDQVGTLRFEANLEYRFPIVGSLFGAAFVDAGNVWLMEDDPARPGGTFSFSNLGKELALSTGFGLRYDLDFLVVRFDLGIGLHAPYDTGKSGYYNMPSFGKSLGYHFAIGYPF